LFTNTYYELIECLCFSLSVTFSHWLVASCEQISQWLNPLDWLYNETQRASSMQL